MRSRVLIGGALVAAAALVGWLLMPGQPQDLAPAIGAGTAPATAMAPPALAGDPQPPAAPLRSPIDIVVSGVATGVGGQNLAIVSVDRGPELLLRVGDSIGGAAKVLRIDRESMTYRNGDGDVRVFVSSGSSTPAPAAPAPVKTYPGFVGAAPPIARASGAEPGSGNEAFRQAIEKKLQAIAAGR